MGKASRIKRERRDGAGIQPTASATRRREFPVFWTVLALIFVVAIGALVVTSPSDAERARNSVADKVPVFADMTVNGEPLPTWSGGETDAAEGGRVPELAGSKFDGFATTLSPADGVARVYVVVAHWCPHCQAEVPRIAKWGREHELPHGVEIVAVSTAVSEDKPNFPPARWMAKERWPYEVLIDDEVGSANDALGVEGFPFLVFADAQGRVVQRFSGEMPIKAFDAAVRELGTSAHHMPMGTAR
jgi:thiol-disulfide isomerase/thioredoxin